MQCADLPDQPMRLEWLNPLLRDCHLAAHRSYLVECLVVSRYVSCWINTALDDTVSTAYLDSVGFTKYP